MSWRIGWLAELCQRSSASVAAELVGQRGSGNWILHLVNFDIARPVDNVVVNLRLPKGRELKQAVMETPDGLAIQVLEANQTGGVASFRVPRLRVYSMVRLTFTSPRS